MKPLKILLIDDEEDFVTTLAERLELREIKTKIATDGETALGIISEEPFSVIVIDLIMPGQNDMEILRRITTFLKGSLETDDSSSYIKLIFS